MYLYFSIGNGQPREPALCQLYQHNLVPHGSLDDVSSLAEEFNVVTVETADVNPSRTHNGNLLLRPSILL